ncbi:diguanylate cyclase domain-containing protein [Butyrivibrio sp. YAB3001]|uniref:diguanylate cyclase domain-containing protein n=1 Tax=Butyrivibrio sp. YAB3001 TaxID=1520812 RepID=UPI0008F62F8E|nr:diguanylate cyclase [Butyrivibrio sp. YAB3001]SFD02252.1 diguanylate cyclase (GGDEF) domain-containing protein [Butyrivibrio sp. YAB3001]
MYILIVGCSIICNTFAHSPVYRIGGDEFVVIAHGKDLDNIEDIMKRLSDINNENKEKGEVTIAAGFAIGTEGRYVKDVFFEADEKMYQNKKRMKGEI